MAQPIDRATLKLNLDNWYFLRWKESGPEAIFLSRDGRWGVSDEAAYFESKEAAEEASRRAFPPPEHFNSFSAMKVRTYIRTYQPLLWDLIHA